jgi:type VI secretion system secreted protein Hcp
MATIAYLAVKAQRLGVITGGVTIAGREGTIAVAAVRSEITTPIDLGTGNPTGKRQHHPLTITVLIDKSAPKLYEVLATNDTLSEVTLAYWRAPPDRGVNPTGGEAKYFTITLANARITAITLSTQDSTQEVLEVQLTYQKITWTWVEGGISAADDWEARV